MTTSFAAASPALRDPNLHIPTFHGLRSSPAPALTRNALPPTRSLSLIRAVSTPETVTEKRSKVEIIKEQSNFIRYPLNEDLLTDAPNLSDSAVQLIKFHGSYQQYNRDERGSRTYSFMIRTKNPCGKVPNRLYLTMDDLADQFGIGTLRLTTRQTFQLHGVVKQDLKTVMASIIRNMGSSLGACGDLNRNVLAPAAPLVRKDYLFAQQTAENIAALLAPQSGFYYDIWVDGERIMSAEPPEVVQARNDNSHGTNFPDSPEPIYGTQFLPRKFKVAVTVPTDNSVDILTNDIGVVVVTDDDGEPQGFNIYVGGGMGRTHRNESTFPRLAEPLGYVPKEDILYAVKAIVVTQRENGRRDDRKYSRMKYLISSWGIEKFRTVVEQYYGKKFEPFRSLPEWEFKSYLGWHQQGDGSLFYGLHVDNGRIAGKMKKALREVIEKYNLNVRLTPNQNVILTDIRAAWKRPITTILAQAGLLQPSLVDPLNRTAMACPAFPLCPLAITEAERGIPDILKRVRGVFEKVGLKYSESVVVRVTGCPNGCARPYMAELGLVGDGPNSYQIWLGGTPNQTSIARSFMDKVKLQDLEKVLEPLFYYWKQKRQSKESFGVFTNRMGRIKICEGKNIDMVLDEEIHALTEKLQKLQKRSLVKDFETRNSRNFDKQVSVLQRRLERIGGPSDEIYLREFEELANVSLSIKTSSRFDDSIVASGKLNVEILRRKMEGLSKGILLQRMEEEYNSLLSTANSSVTSSASTSKRVEFQDSSSSIRVPHQEKLSYEGNPCSGHCKSVVRRIVEQVRTETEQWSQMQEMLGQVREEMEELQASRDFWEDRALHSDFQIQSLHNSLQEWRQRALSFESEKNELRAKLSMLSGDLERLRKEQNSVQGSKCSSIPLDTQ